MVLQENPNLHVNSLWTALRKTMSVLIKSRRALFFKMVKIDWIKFLIVNMISLKTTSNFNIVKHFQDVQPNTQDIYLRIYYKKIVLSDIIIIVGSN